MTDKKIFVHIFMEGLFDKFLIMIIRNKYETSI